MPPPCLTHVPHRDGTDARSLYLPTEAEASTLTYWSGTGVEVLWPHHHSDLGDIVTPISLGEG